MSRPGPSPVESWGGLADVLAAGGETGARIVELDWGRTPIGPPETWPRSLHNALSICMASRFPMCVRWGPDFVTFYNDAFVPILGDKHPDALGRPTREIWPEVWDTIGPMLQQVIDGGAATWSENQLLLLNRRGYTEECYFTFSYGPVRDDAGVVGGVFIAVTETTGYVLGERRLRTLRELGERTSHARNDDEVATAVAEVMATDVFDLPFALLYLPDDERSVLRLTAATGLDPGHPARRETIPLPDPARGSDDKALWTTLDDREVRHLRGLDITTGGWPSGTGPEVTTEALVLPVGQATDTRGPVRDVDLGAGTAAAGGVLVAGVSPRLRLDDDYRSFLTLLARHIGTSLTDARAFAAASARAESLAQLDRAKTLFMSDVSHELRTPLTLLLGPAMEALGEEEDPRRRERLELITRNAHRLLHLVNTLLDFTSLETGNADPQFVPTDVSALTADVASLFRSAVEGAGMGFHVDCAPLPRPALVDREMWERLVVNLLSNAFKFTLSGDITVSLSVDDGDERTNRMVSGNAGTVVLRVSDTGAGIPEGDLSHLFERFHRVRETTTRSRAGSGIGLAMVREIVDLHGGTVVVDTVVGAGTTFTVRLPLPAGSPMPETGPWAASTATTSTLPDALTWLDVPPSPGAAVPDSVAAASTDRTRVLVVDDNADMRGYLRRLLEPTYDVTVMATAEDALEAARRDAPDLVLTDVILPGMDGFELLSRLRAFPGTSRVPVVMLSARAGEESAVQGLLRGADDYLVKPFSARELLARVRANLQLNKLRESAADEATRHARRLDDLARAALLTTSAQSVDDILATLTEQARALIPAHLAVTSLAKEDERSVTEPGAQTGPPRSGHAASDGYHVLADIDASVAGEALRAEVEHTNRPLRLTRTALEAHPGWRDPDGSDADRLPRTGWLAVPMVARDGSNLGLVQLVDREEGDFTAEDESVLVQLAQMAAVRLEAAQAYERERAVAVELQRSLLPQVPSSVTGLMVAARYLPGAAGTQVGGDWYDVIELPGSKTGLVIGDVMGRGLHAAAVMGQLRASLRGYALEGLDPAHVLTRLDSVVRSIDEAQLTTCAYAVFDPADATLRIATAGHLPPLLSTAEGTSRLLDLDPGLPLGVGDPGVHRYTSMSVRMPPGSTLLMFTDGLVEDRELDVGRGLEMLAAAMAEPPASADDACDRALRAMGRDVAHDDDTALLAVCAAPESAPGGAHRTTSRELSRSPRSAAEARGFVTSTLQDWELDGLADMAALLVSELVTNALLHARSSLVVQIMSGPAAVKVSVGDGSAALPQPRRDPDQERAQAAIELAEGGRGLVLVEAIADRWGVESQQAGKRVWFELDVRR